MGLKAHMKKSLMLACMRKQYENMLFLDAHTIYHITDEYTLYASPHHGIAWCFMYCRIVLIGYSHQLEVTLIH